MCRMAKTKISTLNLRINPAIKEAVRVLLTGLLTKKVSILFIFEFQGSLEQPVIAGGEQESEGHQHCRGWRWC